MNILQKTSSIIRNLLQGSSAWILLLILFVLFLIISKMVAKRSIHKIVQKQEAFHGKCLLFTHYATFFNLFLTHIIFLLWTYLILASLYALLIDGNKEEFYGFLFLSFPFLVGYILLLLYFNHHVVLVFHDCIIQNSIFSGLTKTCRFQDFKAFYFSSMATKSGRYLYLNFGKNILMISSNGTETEKLYEYLKQNYPEQFCDSMKLYQKKIGLFDE